MGIKGRMTYPHYKRRDFFFFFLFFFCGAGEWMHVRLLLGGDMSSMATSIYP